MTTIRFILLSVLTLSMGCKSIETATFTARGCCPTCERLILDVVDIESIKAASWSQFDEQLTLKYFANLTTENDLQKKVALAGYDTDLFKATDSVYLAMPKCCQYRD